MACPETINWLEISPEQQVDISLSKNDQGQCSI